MNVNPGRQSGESAELYPLDYQGWLSNPFILDTFKIIYIFHSLLSYSGSHGLIFNFFRGPESLLQLSTRSTWLHSHFTGTLPRGMWCPEPLLFFFFFNLENLMIYLYKNRNFWEVLLFSILFILFFISFCFKPYNCFSAFFGSVILQEMNSLRFFFCYLVYLYF